MRAWLIGIGLGCAIMIAWFGAEACAPFVLARSPSTGYGTYMMIGAVVALIRLVLPLAVGQLGAAGGIVVAALNIVIWAVVAIAVIIVVFDLMSCLVGMPRLR